MITVNELCETFNLQTEEATQLEKSMGKLCKPKLMSQIYFKLIDANLGKCSLRNKTQNLLERKIDQYFNQKLDEEGITDFDKENLKERVHALSIFFITHQVSFKLLTSGNKSAWHSPISFDRFTAADLGQLRLDFLLDSHMEEIKSTAPKADITPEPATTQKSETTSAS